MVSVTFIMITIIDIAFANKSKSLLKYLNVAYLSIFMARLSTSEVNMATECLKPSKSVDICGVSYSIIKGSSCLHLHF
jgi:hypothetical protein